MIVGIHVYTCLPQLATALSRRRSHSRREFHMSRSPSDLANALSRHPAQVSMRPSPFDNALQCLPVAHINKPEGFVLCKVPSVPSRPVCPEIVLSAVAIGSTWLSKPGSLPARNRSGPIQGRWHGPSPFENVFFSEYERRLMPGFVDF